MKKQIKNLLPKRFSDWGALTGKLSKIKLGFPKGFTTLTSKLTIVALLLFSLLGYYPTFGWPPVKQSIAKASVQEQKGEVISYKFSKPIILPHPGYLSTRFSTWHPGIDIATGLGMPIHPIIDGTITKATTDIFGLGKYVEVAHEDGFTSKYCHMGKIYVKVGDKVTEENLLGEVGLTGHTSGPHTHLEITHNGNYIDPQTLLPEIPNMPTVYTASVKK